MNGKAKRRSPLLRDAIADWRRWSAGEKVAACALTTLVGATGPVLLAALALPAPV